MNAVKSTMPRPQRWDEPFDPNMSDATVERLLREEPFCLIDPSVFKNNVPLTGILRNDCRLLNVEPGDIVVREGDYGNSAYLVLSGEVLVSLQSLPPEITGRAETRPKGWGRAIAQLWQNSPFREQREYAGTSGADQRLPNDGTAIFLHDIPRVLGPGRAVSMEPGEIFGEISALTRTPRSATVIANQPTQLLEIRWQGFRDLLRRHEPMRDHVERLYRENSLLSHLREVDVLKSLSTEALTRVAEATKFETYGNFQWNRDYKSTDKKDISERILAEPLIAAEGDYVDGLILIRNGFARQSRKHGDGHQTINYLAKGDVFGLRELAHNHWTSQQRPWMLSLRAVGYVDILRIPTDVFEEFVLPQIAVNDLPPPLPHWPSEKPGRPARQTDREEAMDSGLMEFLVEQRFINGTQTMMIDLNRCTRCDDCVRACAATHDNNPRFIRHGPKYDHWMIANACMHCLDPVCMIGCPTGAIGRDLTTGNVIINDQTCIGCATCANSCPYTNIRMVEINDRSGLPIIDEATGEPILKATKCDLCVEQLGGPACQRACPHDALVRIDMTNPKPVTAWSKR